MSLDFTGYNCWWIYLLDGQWGYSENVLDVRGLEPRKCTDIKEIVEEMEGLVAYEEMYSFQPGIIENAQLAYEYGFRITGVTDIDTIPVSVDVMKKMIQFVYEQKDDE